jgi:hypothetical protein
MVLGFFSFHLVVVLSRSVLFSILFYLCSLVVYQRGGSIVPRKLRIRRSSTQMAGDPITLAIALDTKGRAEGDIYIDDGKTYEKLERRRDFIIIIIIYYYYYFAGFGFYCFFAVTIVVYSNA